MIKVLLIEDNGLDARLFSELLMDGGETVEITWVKALAEAETVDPCLFDVVVTDMDLPDGTGIRTVERVLARFQGVPVVVLTGNACPEASVTAVKMGCQDYVVKGDIEPRPLARILRHAIERFSAKQALKESEERFRVLIEMSPDAILLVSGGRVTFANGPARRFLQAPQQTGCSLEDTLRGADANEIARQIQGVTTEPKCRRLGEYKVESAEGDVRIVEVFTAGVRIKSAMVTQVILRDVTVRIEHERERRLIEAVFRTSAEAMMITDARHNILAVNQAFSDITGYTTADVVGRRPSVLSSGRHDIAFYREIWSSVAETGHWRGEVWNRKADGGLYVQRLTISEIRDENGRVTNYVGVFSDITDEKQESDRLAHRATHDALTDLPNRSLFGDRLEQALNGLRRHEARPAVLFIDLDGFKPVNDRYGHLVGDQLLQAVANRLLGCVRGSDTVARLGGDEFVVLLNTVEDLAAVETVAAKIIDVMCRPFPVGEARIHVGCSIGLALAPEDGQTVDALLNSADEAMYAAKHAGKGTWRSNHTDMPDQAAC